MNWLKWVYKNQFLLLAVVSLFFANFFYQPYLFLSFIAFTSMFLVNLIFVKAVYTYKYKNKSVREWDRRIEFSLIGSIAVVWLVVMGLLSLYGAM